MTRTAIPIQTKVLIAEATADEEQVVPLQEMPPYGPLYSVPSQLVPYDDPLDA